jgi:hypothetical protein
LKFRLRIAAAATILVAFASVATLSRSRVLPLVVETGKTLSWNDRFTAEKFTTLTLPDVAILKVNQNTILRFENARSVVLEAGELFAEITPPVRASRSVPAIRSRGPRGRNSA